MRVMAVDDEKLALDNLVGLLSDELPGAEIVAFSKSADAFAYLEENHVDIAFLDIEMGTFSGLTLAEKCKKLCPAINIIFVTGFLKYAMDALRLHVSGYLTKPVRTEDLRMELADLRHPLQQYAPPHGRVRIQTFGNFEVFVDEKPLKVPRTKCKECLAYLVDRRGAGVGYAQLTSVLWENHPLDRSAQKTRTKSFPTSSKHSKM